jgi:hypothetical protein
MKNLFGLLVTFLMVTNLIAQSVGIGTTIPDPSAALHIYSTNKGVLFPNVYLAATVDYDAVLNPAPGLVVFNTNASLAGGKGLYYNSGTAQNANWAKVGDLKLPYTSGTSSNFPAFSIQNFSAGAVSTGILGYSENGHGLHGNSYNGIGVYAECSNGNALEVAGKLKIAGTGQSPAAGKVLTSDANGNATWQALSVAFSCKGVKAGASSIIAGTTFVKVPFWAEQYDLGNNYNNSEVSPHSTFTAPYYGIYHFDAQITWAYSTWDDRYSIVLMANYNGSIFTLAESDGRLGDGTDSRAISIDVPLYAGTQVYVQAYQNSSDPLGLVTESQYSFFNGRLITRL